MFLRLSCFSSDMNYLLTTYLVKCRECGRGGNVEVLMCSAHKGDDGKSGGSLTETKYFCTSVLPIQPASLLVKKLEGRESDLLPPLNTAIKDAASTQYVNEIKNVK